MRRFLPLLLALGCTGPGTLYSPEGRTELRTARYRVGVRDGAPEIVVLLSNGFFDCGIPRYDDPAELEAALNALAAAACREGAQHMALYLYRRDDGWSGEYPGRSGARASDLDERSPKLARGTFYAIEEAFLVELEGLARGYAAEESLLLDNLGDGGQVQIDLDSGDELAGWFDFPWDDVSGEFRAERCTGDSSVIDVVANSPNYYCE